MLFITSDHHFCHKNIIKYCDRPFRSVEEMDAMMIRNWNSTVKKDDIVLHLGDFALTSSEHMKDIRNRLNGTIFIILGNHDKSRLQMAKAGFIAIEGNSVTIDDMIFTHRPLGSVPKQCINVHGHIHEKDTTGNRFNICVDKTDYYPVSIVKLKEMIECLN